MPDLTSRQQQVYAFIVHYVDCYGSAPTLQEIAGHLGVRGNLGVLRHLQALEKKGYIERTKAGSRGIRVARRTTAHTLPLVGTIAAGPLQEALELAEGSIQVDATLVHSENSFVLRVSGDSMIDAHILDGDLAVVRPQATADNGDIVVAVVNGEATLKRFFRDAHRIRLQPENPHLEPILLAPDSGDFRLAGKVTGIIRTFGG